jgi:hypothetical protein
MRVEPEDYPPPPNVGDLILLNLKPYGRNNGYINGYYIVMKVSIYNKRPWQYEITVDRAIYMDRSKVIPDIHYSSFCVKL